MRRKNDSATKTVDFDKHAGEAVAQLRRTFAAVVDALPSPITKAADLQHTLRIDKVLGWRIYNVIRCADPFAAARYVPGSGGVKIFLNAAERQGVPTTLTDPAASAVGEYQRLLRIHAGNRKRLDMMLAAHSNEGRAEIDSTHRRLAYEANSYIWGVSAEVQLRAAFVGFSQTPGEVDLAALRGFVRLQRIRPNVSWPLGWGTCVDDKGGKRKELAIEPLYDVRKPDQKAASIFMSNPRPHINCIEKNGALEWELAPGPVGKTGAVTCVTGEIERRAGSYECKADNEYATYTVRIRTACELLIFDQFVHEDLYGRIEPEMLLYGHIADSPRNASDRLPVHESVQYMGKASDVLHTPEVPHYADMVNFVFDGLNWDQRRFHAYRVRMEYPIMPSEVKMRNPLRRTASKRD